MTAPAPNPLIAAPADETPWYAGITIVEGLVEVKNGIESGSWVSTTIGGLGVAIDATLFYLNPVAASTSWVVAAFVEHVEFLSEALDWLAGDPNQVAANAQTWANIAGHIRLAADEYREAIWRQLPTWTGEAAKTYRAGAEVELLALQMVVSQLLYAVELNRVLDDGLAQRLAAMMIERWSLPSDPEVYHAGLSLAIEQEDMLAGQELETRHSDATLREFFRRIVAHLDAGRPWPPPRWERLPDGDWPWAQAPAIATLRGGLSYVSGKFHNFPDQVAASEGATHVLVLRLRTGEVVALEVAMTPTPAKDRTQVKVLDGDPDTALQSLVELARIPPEDVTRMEGTQ